MSLSLLLVARAGASSTCGNVSCSFHCGKRRRLTTVVLLLFHCQARLDLMFKEFVYCCTRRRSMIGGMVLLHCGTRSARR
jgi:hypothetical protein